MNKIDINKQYRTISGDKVEILKTGVSNRYWSVAALITNDDGVQYLEAYSDDGHVRLDKQPSQNDLVEISPYEDFKIDEPVMVRQYDTSTWSRRYFAGVDEKGRAKAWNFGVTSWTADPMDTQCWSSWNKCRRPTPEELKPV